MIYLNITERGEWLRTTGGPAHPEWEGYKACYLITPEVDTLFDHWFLSPASVENLSAGILADYLEDHKEEQLPVRPCDACWNAMIAVLRLIFSGDKNDPHP